MTNYKKTMGPIERPSFDEIFERYKFHHMAVTFHANLARILGEQIHENYQDEARQTGYFTEKFFDELENTETAESGTPKE